MAVPRDPRRGPVQSRADRRVVPAQETRTEWRAEVRRGRRRWAVSAPVARASLPALGQAPALPGGGEDSSGDPLRQHAPRPALPASLLSDCSCPPLSPDLPIALVPARGTCL